MITRTTTAAIQIGDCFLMVNIKYKNVVNYDMDGAVWLYPEWSDKTKRHEVRQCEIPQSLLTAFIEGSSYDIVGACANQVSIEVNKDLIDFKQAS